MGLILKFAAAFGILGLVVSLLFGFIGGNRPTAVIITAVICAVLGGGLGVGVYKVLEARVPEILTAFESGAASDASVSLRDAERARAALEDEGDTTALRDADDYGSGQERMAEDEEAPVARETAATGATGADGVKSYGDHIIVNKVKIKNEPKLMAAAIRTMLTKE